MNKKFKIQTISWLVLLVVVFCGFLFIKMYRSSPIDINKETAALSISSKKLLTTFSTNEVSANSTYVEKIIVVKGEIKKINHINDRYTVILQGQSDISHILCDMSLSQIKDVKKLEIGQNVEIKGICKGYLMDVIMLNCILVNKERK